MKFALVTLHVKNIDKSIEFYNGLLEMPIVRRQPIGADKELIFMGVNGEVNLELVPSDTDVAYSGFSIGFEVENLSATKEKLAASGYIPKKEVSPNPNLTLCFIDGPSGEEVELIEYK